MFCRAEVLDTIHVLERLSCKSCDYVRTMSTTQPKVSLRQRRRETKCKNRGCYYDVINNHKTGVPM